MNKINYYEKSLQIADKLKKFKKKRRLLLHACCGPCSTYPLVFLTKFFNVTIYFGNSNIYPESEYLRRLEELKKFLEYFERDYGEHIDVVVGSYEHEKYMEELVPFKSLREGKLRCLLCYEKRMKEAYDYADKNGYDYFTTVMTISRQKNSELINQIGLKLEEEHSFTKYFYSDFKKKKGIDKAREMRIHYDLYQQLYCGCEYSIESSLKRKNKNEEN